MGKLDGNVAIVTGAASGIGREHALLFAKEGASVVVNDIRDTAHVVEDIGAAGGVAIGHCGDIADWKYAHELIRHTVEVFDHLDSLVNNAGGTTSALASDLTEEAWDQDIRLNLKGMFCPTRAALGYWKHEGLPGAVVNTTSGAGLLSNVGQAPYGAAKAAVAAFTVSVASELLGTGIRLNAVAPTARTPASEGASATLARLMAAPDDEATFDPFHPRNISPLVAYLCTKDCPVTGEVFHIRGGNLSHFEGWTIGESVLQQHTLTISEVAELVPGMVARAPDRNAAGGAAFGAWRDAFLKEQASADGARQRNETD